MTYTPVLSRAHAGSRCEVCGKIEATALHPCRFELSCSCWQGVPCSWPRGHCEAEEMEHWTNGDGTCGACGAKWYDT